jgi:predicted TIM-barrel fold metal-dependent hydrolase
MTAPPFPPLPDHHCHGVDLIDFVRAVAGTDCMLVLLHYYPYHRGSGYLTHAFPHVYADVGLALNYTGARAEAVLGEMLELTPFGKLPFSTDAYGLSELYVVGARLFAEALTRLLTRRTRDGSWSREDAERVTGLISADNARRAYGPAPG